jgi:hypothetical protein
MWFFSGGLPTCKSSTGNAQSYRLLPIYDVFRIHKIEYEGACVSFVEAHEISRVRTHQDRFVTLSFVDCVMTMLDTRKHYTDISARSKDKTG